MKTYKYFTLLFIMAAQISSVCAQSILSLDAKIKTKIDPLLQQAIIQKEHFPGRPMASVESYTAGTRLSVMNGDAVAVLIQAPNDIQIRNYIKSIGGIIGSQHGSIYTALVPVQSVAQLAQQATVSYIEASRKLFSSLDLSRPKTGADVLQSYPDTTKRLTGKGVIIGFTDTGINTDHPNFKLPDGRTRILYVWDQYGSGTPPAGFSYGVEKDSSAINAHTWSMPDYYEHGTHTSGIAAGNGMPSMQYIGMAPEADIIMVANQGADLFNRGLTTVGTLDGYDYIRTKANALHKRFVINTSQGTNLGPHDGTTLFEQAINADVAAGNVHCISAGNEATSSRHASAVITTALPQVIQCSLSDGSGTSVPMDIWYETNDRLELRIKESSNAGYLSFFPPVDSTITYSLNSVDLTVTTKIGSPLNGDNEIYIVFQEKTSSCNLQLQFSAQAGNTLPDGGRVDLWWERNSSVLFTDHVDQSITIGMPACADSAITVASYNNRSGYGSVDDISTFSAHGPRRDGIMKPDIAAIGGMVISSVGSGSYATFSGTSMSSPHVAGAVALLLQQDSTLTNYQIKQKLFAAATADGFTGAVPNPTWGYGKLNVLKAAGLHGIPIINISKDTVYFPSAFIAIKTNDSVTIKNLGNEDLTINNVSVSDPIFSVDRTSFVIPPRSQDKLIINVTPVSVGSFSGSITLTSNDSINPISVINVVGYSDYPPAITTAPDSFSVAILEGDSTTRTLTIGNTGQGRLMWNISYNSIIQNVPAYLVMQQVNASRNKIPVINLSYDEANGIDRTSNKISSDKLYSQSTKASNVDQKSVLLAPGFLNANPSGGVIEDFETGSWPWSPWVSWGGGGTIVSDAYHGMQAILNPGWYYRTDVTVGSPGDKLSMWVKPGDSRFYLGFGATSLGAWSLVAGVNTNTLVLQQNTEYDYSDLASVPQSWVPGSWYKMEVTFLNGGVIVGRLYASDGTTLLNTVSTTLTGFTPAGVAIRGFGINSGFTGDYITQDLSGKWLSTDPSNGIVTPNGSQDVTVKFNAKGVKGGDYRSNIVINNNDPLHNPKLVPANLHVIGKPIIHVSPDSLIYGIRFIGIARVDTIVIENIGSDVLQVNNISVSDTAFHLNITSFSVPSDGRVNLLLTYMPASPGIFTATVSISSNDSSSLLKTIPIIGEAAYPPIITVTPDSFAVTLASGDSVTQTMTIGNAGAGSLTWNINSFNRSSLFYKTTSLSVSKEKVMQSITSEGLKTIPGTDGVVRTITPTPQRLKLSQLNSAINGVGKVLIIGDGSTEYSIDSLLSKEGISSTIVSSDGIYDGTNPSLDEYSTVILCDGYSGWSIGMPAAGQTAIVDFINAGGNLIVMEWVAYEIYSGRYTILAPYIPVLRSGGNTGTEIYSVVAKGPITEGVDSTFSVTTATNVGTARFGTVLVKGTLCGDAVVIHDVGKGRIVQFASAGNYTGFNPFSEHNMSRLLLNSVFQSSFVFVTPSSGAIAAGSFQHVDVKFNAKNLIGGDYRSIISIASNDPVNGVKSIPVHLTVTGSTGVASDVMIVIPKEFALRQNYPNPFNPSTTIRYDLPISSHVKLSIYNLLGKLVTMLVDEDRPAGIHSVQWNCQTNYGTAASGVYFAVIHAGDFRKTVKMVLMK